MAEDIDCNPWVQLFKLNTLSELDREFQVSPVSIFRLLSEELGDSLRVFINWIESPRHAPLETFIIIILQVDHRFLVFDRFWKLNER